MLIFSSFEEMELSLTDIMNFPWTFYFKDYQFSLNLELFIGPKFNFLGIFNRLAKTKSSYTFSIDQNINLKHFNRISDKLQKRKNKNFTCSISDIKDCEPIRLFEDPYKRIMFIINGVFSESYIQENKLVYNDIKQHIENLKNELSEKIDSKSFIESYRIEEIINDLRIILAISPIDNDMKLSFAHISDIGIFNPVTAYFKKLFAYSGYFYLRFCNKHEVSFYEEQGYPQYPLAENNKQFFEIQFNIFADDSLQKVINQSARSLKKYLTDILFVLDLYIGNDQYGRNSNITETDYFVANLPENQFKCQFFNNQRLYSGPEYNIIINFHPNIVEDDNNVEFPIFSLEIMVNPFDNKIRPKIGTYLHPIIYDAEK